VRMDSRCILSSPLTLSLDFRNETAVDSVWGIISNTAAIGVNQQWAGMPGTVFASAPSTVDLGPRVPLRGAARNAVDSDSQERVGVPSWQVTRCRACVTAFCLEGIRHSSLNLFPFTHFSHRAHCHLQGVVQALAWRRRRGFGSKPWRRICERHHPILRRPRPRTTATIARPVQSRLSD
jgi:hypothetical protein